MTWINDLISDYYKWLKDNTVILSDHLSDWVLINTPFIGLFNDNIEIYAKRENNHIKLSDNGETFHNLELAGVNINRSSKRRDIVESILLNYGIRTIGEELVVECDNSTFAKKKHCLLSAILELNDLYVLSEHNIFSIFKEDVRKYLEELNVNYTVDFISKGTTGLEFAFDFQISMKNEEVVIKSFNSLNKATLLPFLFAWEDIKPVREKVSKKIVKAIAVVNDTDKEIRSEFIDALNSKKAEYVLWSDRYSNDNKQKFIRSA